MSVESVIKLVAWPACLFHLLKFSKHSIHLELLGFVVLVLDVIEQTFNIILLYIFVCHVRDTEAEKETLWLYIFLRVLRTPAKQLS